jgi:hypothetical protein
MSSSASRKARSVKGVSRSPTRDTTTATSAAAMSDADPSSASTSTTTAAASAPQWTCEACNTKNGGAAKSCTACTLVRTNPPSSVAGTATKAIAVSSKPAVSSSKSSSNPSTAAAASASVDPMQDAILNSTSWQDMHSKIVPPAAPKTVVALDGKVVKVSDKDEKQPASSSSSSSSSSAAVSTAAAASSSSSSSSSAAKAAPAAGLSAAIDEDEHKGAPVKLVSKDHKEFTIDRKSVFLCNLIKTSLDNNVQSEKSGDVEIPIPGVDGATLELIINYLKEHKGVAPAEIDKPLRSKQMKDVCPYKWDAEYIDKIGDTRQQLYNVVLGANYMECKPLLALGIAKTASLIKGQPLEKIKEILDPKLDGKRAEEKKKQEEEKKKDEKKEDKKGAAASAASSSSSSSSASSSSSSAASAAAADKKDEKKDDKKSKNTAKPKPSAAAAAAAAASKPGANDDDDDGEEDVHSDSGSDVEDRKKKSSSAAATSSSSSAPKKKKRRS